MLVDSSNHLIARNNIGKQPVVARYDAILVNHVFKLLFKLMRCLVTRKDHQGLVRNSLFLKELVAYRGESSESGVHQYCHSEF
jgi:hypothetical protein